MKRSALPSAFGVGVGVRTCLHVKTISSQQRRALLTARKLILNKIRDIENDIRGLLRNFGLKVGLIGRIGFVARIRELLEGMVDLAEIIEPLLSARQQLRESFEVLHRKVLSIVRNDLPTLDDHSGRWAGCRFGLCQHDRHTWTL